MLVKWILETSDTLPANASHRVGIGAFVMNDKGEVSLFKLMGPMVLPNIVLLSVSRAFVYVFILHLRLEYAFILLVTKKICLS